jgi:hypothetical protein
MSCIAIIRLSNEKRQRILVFTAQNNDEWLLKISDAAKKGLSICKQKLNLNSEFKYNAQA